METPPESPRDSNDISESQEGPLRESQKHSAIFSFISLSAQWVPGQAPGLGTEKEAWPRLALKMKRNARLAETPV